MPFCYRATAFDDRRRTELGLLRRGTLSFGEVYFVDSVLRVFLEQCEWLYSKMWVGFLKGDESLCSCIFHVQQRSDSGKDRRQSCPSFPGWKNCRGLLLMQSEVQKPIWSSLGWFCLSSESVLVPNTHSVLGPELCLLFSSFHQLKEIWGRKNARLDSCCLLCHCSYCPAVVSRIISDSMPINLCHYERMLSWILKILSLQCFIMLILRKTCISHHNL